MRYPVDAGSFSDIDEATRIENAATEGVVLASKHLLERLDPDAARALDLDLDTVASTPLAELESSSDEAVGDAGSIRVAAI